MSVAQIQSRLLTAAELDGWQPGSVINSDDLASFAQLPCEGADLDPVIAQRLIAVTGVQFEPVDHSYKHLIELVATGDAAQLGSDLGALFGAVESCSTNAAATSPRVTVNPFTIPTMGDQQAAYGLTLTDASSTSTVVYVRIGYVRIGPLAVALGLADFEATSSGASDVDDQTYRALLQAAVAKLGA